MLIIMRVFIVLSFMVTSSVLPKKIYISENNVSLMSTVESINSFISYVLIDDCTYIIKQKKSPEKQFSVVRDALAAYIAKDLAIAHSVEIIALNKDFPGKVHVLSPATILTIAPGATVRSQTESKYYNLCLKQRTPDGNILPNQWLTEQIINQITWHWQLPIIIGLDLFICNTDRHGGNLFYDSQTDSFCAIDMDNIFRRDLPALACEKLNLMIRGGKKFTQQEIEALIVVRNTIQFLLNRYTTRKLISRLRFFVKQAGFSENNLMYTEKIAKKIARHKEMIIQSRVSLYRLINMLNQIFSDFYK